MCFFFGGKLCYSDDEDLKGEESLECEEGFGNIIVVDNLPVVPKEKFEKLEGVIRKIYSQIGVIKEDGLWMPVDPETQKTLGYCFIEYNTPQVTCGFFFFHVVLFVLSHLLFIRLIISKKILSVDISVDFLS